jgi:hypothetical protein
MKWRAELFGILPMSTQISFMRAVDPLSLQQVLAAMTHTCPQLSLASGEYLSWNDIVLIYRSILSPMTGCCQVTEVPGSKWDKNMIQFTFQSSLRDQLTSHSPLAVVRTWIASIPNTPWDYPLNKSHESLSSSLLPRNWPNPRGKIIAGKENGIHWGTDMREHNAMQNSSRLYVLVVNLWCGQGTHF